MEKEAYIVCRREGSRILATEYAEGGSRITLASNVTSPKPKDVELEGSTTVRIFMDYEDALREAKLRCDVMGDKKIRLLKIKVNTDDVFEVPYGDDFVHRTNKFSWDCLCFF